MKIIDDFLEEDYRLTILQRINHTKFKLHSSNGGRFNFLHAFSSHPDFNLLRKKILNLPILKNVNLRRWYINLNPYGEFHSGDWHRDTNDGSNITAIYYPQEWQKEYGGGIEFEDGEIIEYKQNRLVVFDGEKGHMATPHFNEYNFRFSLAFKLMAEWNEDSINN